MLRIMLVAIMTTLAAVATAEVVDDFEGYADTPNLTSTWYASTGSPAQTLSTSVAHSGSKSMQVEFNGANERLTWNLPVPENWTDSATVVFWVLGSPSNPSGTVNFGIRTGTAGCSYGFYTVSTTVGEWTPLYTNLADCPGDFTDVLNLDFYLASGSPGGDPVTIWIDDLSRPVFADGFETGATNLWFTN